ncbi:MAG TPA: cytochrome c family protein [Vitreimonas sp.]|uniref:cytochrome c family protein n=1 Tax=Vitreimonas sp. TaxID=3069702 RepID=UPI002D2D0CF0|nr:cytochrome c family protein [Vitreimonas sp.]HYD88300.1 cytochrome c family protein [Vitreimonas sp.]
MRRLLLATVLIAALAGCGQGETQAPSSSSTAPVAAQGARSPEEIQAALAALPGPYATANYEAGRRVFAQCRSCHTINAGGQHRVGPNLHGVFGREIGTAAGFNYSQAVQNADFAWDAAQLDHWLANPQTFLPGNRMAFAGVRDEEQRRDVIAYLMIETAPQ